MTETYNLGDLGEVKVRPPHSMTAINDVCSEYLGEMDGGSRAKLARVLAAAIGISWSEENRDKPPKYNVATGEVVAFGGSMLEWLLKRGIARSDVFSMGHLITAELWAMLPKEQEVAATAASFPEDSEPGSDDTQNREKLGA